MQELLSLTARDIYYMILTRRNGGELPTEVWISPATKTPVERFHLYGNVHLIKCKDEFTIIYATLEELNLNDFLI